MADTDFNAWVNELDKIEPPGSAASGRAGRGKSKSGTALAELEQEMKLLHWHKLANEAALKAALIRTKRLKEKSSTENVQQERGAEKAAWMQQIIEEEQGKPLEVNEDFIRNFEERERNEEARVEKEVQRHIATLKKLKMTLKERNELKERNRRYREKRAAMGSPIPGSGSLQSSPSEPTRGASRAGAASRQGTADGGRAGDTRSAVGGSATAHGSLGKVISSLDKLVELEKRISNLEKEYDEPGAGSPQRGMHAARPVGSRGRVVFEKKRSAAGVTAPSKTYFHVKVKGNTARGRQRGRSGRSNPRGGGNSGTFMTGLPDVNDGAAARGRQRQQQRRGRSMGPAERRRAGERSRSRVRGGRRAMGGREQQDDVVSDWLKERTQKKKARRARVRTNARSMPPRGGRTQSKARDHKQHFHEVRRQFDRKRQQM